VSEEAWRATHAEIMAAIAQAQKNQNALFAEILRVRAENEALRAALAESDARP
jgi:hypothetical protein